MSTIPASLFTSVNPEVLSAGGNQLQLNGLMLTTSSRVPIGSVASFASALAVSNFFGASSNEAKQAAVYFQGYSGATQTPGALLFAQYNTASVAAYLESGNITSALTLAQIQLINGSFTVIMDGYSRTGVINLSGVPSFSAAAGVIGSGLNSSLSTLANFTGSIAGGTLTVSAVASGVLAIGQTVQGSGVAANTYITGLLTGTGGTGTYSVSNSQVIGSEALTTQPTPVNVTFDSVSGAFFITSGVTGSFSTAAYATGAIAASLLLTQATGAVLSQGAAAATPAAFMNALIQVTQNWASFMLLFDPDNGVGNAQRLAFAQWTNTTANRYVFVCRDDDITATLSVPATASLGYLIQQANYSGTCLVWEATDLSHCAFVCGAIASVNFNQTGGRVTFAYLSLTGLVAGVTSAQVAINLGGNPQVAGDFGNGYNYYGAVATAAQNFTYFQRGTVSGPFKWLDTYINQIWLNNQFQLDLQELLTNIGSLPYNAAGNATIESALAPTITQAGAFGAYRPGVPLSATQILNVNNAAGKNIANTLQTRGWYLLIGTVVPSVRQARGTPPMTFFYTDGESVQAMSLTSVVLQ